MLDLDRLEENWKGFGYRSDAVGQASGVIELLIAELRASRKVVEAARPICESVNPRYDSFMEPDLRPLRAALAELSSINVVSTGAGGDSGPGVTHPTSFPEGWHDNGD